MPKKKAPKVKPIRVPSAATLRKYGLSMKEWYAILKRQGGVCAICKKRPPSGRLCIDHHHAEGWKQMEPEDRKQYVRGLLCWTDNHYAVGRGVTLEKARNVVSYLEWYSASWGALEKHRVSSLTRTTKTTKAPRRKAA